MCPRIPSLLKLNPKNFFQTLAPIRIIHRAPHPVSNSVGLRDRLTCSSNKLPGDANTIDSRTALRKPLS